jgi:aspartyl aminopeptidase
MPNGRPKKLEKNKALMSRARERALDLIAFIDKSPTPYHAVKEAIRRLERAKFSRLDEGEEWKLKPGDRRFVTRNGSSLIAFQVGTKPPVRSGFKMIGAHTDSPNLKLKPRASYNKQGFRQLGVEMYGGVLIHTWLDRDLSIAGRIAVRGAKGVEMVLVDLERPVLRIPNLAIHMNRDVNREGFKVNLQTQLPPVWALEGEGGKKNGEDGDFLKAVIAERAGVAADRILDHDLSLYDVQKGTLSGLEDEFVQVARLDNLGSSYAAVEALIACADDPGHSTRMIALHDHEEVGSRSAQGAAGPFLEHVVSRIVEITDGKEPQALARAIAASFHISADMAHAVHPNYSDKHEPQHMPMIGLGPVIKANAGQSYATDGESAAVFAALCLEAGFEPQNYVVRSDLGCGSTIGPITATRLGVKTVDIGNPMLSMHSIREMSGTLDTELMHRALSMFFTTS